MTFENLKFENLVEQSQNCSTTTLLTFEGASDNTNLSLTKVITTLTNNDCWDQKFVSQEIPSLIEFLNETNDSNTLVSEIMDYYFIYMRDEHELMEDSIEEFIANN